MIKEEITRMKAWLSLNAQGVLEQLQSGASDVEFTRLEDKINKKLPLDFKELYRVYNGMDEREAGGLFYGMEFLSIDQIIKDYDLTKTDREKQYSVIKTDVGINDVNISNPNWLSIAFDGSHTSIRLDLAPTDAGTYGQVIFVDNEFKIAILLANSVGNFVKTFADDLNGGLYSTEDYRYLMPDESIDIINWSHAERWKYFDQA